MNEFFNMGGYAFFVWGSYGLVAVVLALNYWTPRVRHRQLIRELRSMLKRDRSRNLSEHRSGNNS